MYYYVVYEDDFAIYLCILMSKGIADECVCIQRIHKGIGYCEDGTFESLCSELAENPEAWKEWKHSELVPSLMFTREIADNYTQIAVTADVTHWTHLKAGEHLIMSDEAEKLIVKHECAECRIQDGGDDV